MIGHLNQTVSVRELRTNLPRMMVFARVAELSSFTAAAAELGIGRPAVSSAVAALEASLGVTLLHRSTRSCELTQVGRELFERCALVRDLASEAILDASAASEELVGTLRLAAPGGLIGARLVAPVLAQLARDHGLSAELQCEDRRVGLVAGGFDAALRVGTPREAGLIMRRVGRTPEVLVASPAVAATICEPADLDAAPWVVHAALPRRIELIGPGRRRRALVMRATVVVNDGAAMMGLLRHGAGVGVVPLVTSRPELDSGALVRLFEGSHVRQADIFVLLPSRKRVPRRVRLFIEGLQAWLALG